MILPENKRVMMEKFPLVWEVMKHLEANIQNESLQVIAARNGETTLSIQKENKIYYVHSQYDPGNEAARQIDQMQDVEKYKHVFFYGVGLGYHVESFLNKFPNLTATLYEPNPAAFYYYMSLKPFHEIAHRIDNICLEWSSEQIPAYLNFFVNTVNENVFFYSLPAYERIYVDRTKDFYESFKKMVEFKRFNLRTNSVYEKLWTMNSTANLPKVLQTQNILREKKSFFAGKPALLVAAGPSLQEEFENIRYIKENGLAYIFAVGSANKSLIMQNIYPDAICSFDPTPLQLKVFSEIIEQQIDSIPLIFGTSINAEITKQYPGPMLHMFTSPDTVSPYYFGEKEIRGNLEIVSDAPSVAVLTLELFAKLGCKSVYLVGQNFAFKNNQYYAKTEGLTYGARTAELTEAEKASSLTVESVDGGEVYTDEGNNKARYQMEQLINTLKPMNMVIINTTNGGAKIQGTEFIPLRQIISEKLHTRVVDNHWFEGEITDYSADDVGKQVKTMDVAYEKVQDIFQQIERVFKRLERLASYDKSEQIEDMVQRMDVHIGALRRNEFYKVYLKAMARVEFELIERTAEAIRMETNPIAKVKMIMEAHGKWINGCKESMQYIKPLMDQAHESMGQYANTGLR